MSDGSLRENIKKDGFKWIYEKELKYKTDLQRLTRTTIHSKKLRNSSYR